MSFIVFPSLSITFYRVEPNCSYPQPLENPLVLFKTTEPNFSYGYVPKLNILFNFPREREIFVCDFKSFVLVLRR